MEICYWQSTLSDKTVIRGDLDNWLDFAFYNTDTGEWDYSNNTFYADNILVSGGVAYRDLTEQQATEIINGNTGKSD